MSTNFYQQYLEGNCREVWLDLIKLGAAIHTDEYKEDVDKVVRETMTRVRENIVMLTHELSQSDFIFTDVNKNAFDEDVRRDINKSLIHTQPSEYTKQELLELRELSSPYGHLPLSITSFFEIVGAVDFAGYFPEWNAKEMVPTLDPLVVSSLHEVIDYHKWWLEEGGGTYHQNEEDQYYLWFSPDKDDKEYVSSSGAGYGIQLQPQMTIDAPLAYYWADISFVDYLRICFRWAGFPNLQRYDISYLKGDTLDFVKSVAEKLRPI